MSDTAHAGDVPATVAGDEDARLQNLGYSPIMSGLAGIDTHAYRGIQQRVFTLVIFPPIGVSAFVLARCVRWLSVAGGADTMT